MQFDEVTSIEYVNGSLASLSSDNSVKSEFGNFQDTGDWVECESKSFPGQTYFYNLRTFCATWTRPVSHKVTLQRYRGRLRIDETNFTRDIYSHSGIISSESENDRRSPNGKSGSHFRRSPKEVIAWLYHGADVDINNCFDDSENDYTDSFVPDALTVLRDVQDACSSHELAFYEVGDHFLANNNNFDKIQILNGVVQNVAPTADYLEVKLSTSNDPIKLAERNGPPKDTNDDSLIVEKCIAFSSSSSENCRSPVLVRNYYAPRLPKIKSKYLLKEKFAARRKGRISKKKPVRKTPRKIVCEMYGTKTINYDPVELDLPPGVKITNLSDSSVISSLWGEQHAKPAGSATNLQHIDFGVVTKNLSSDSTTSSSCTSCSCCSTSSSTSQNSVSNTTMKEGK